MRINQYVAKATGLSRRAVDDLIKLGNVSINKDIAKLTSQVSDNDEVLLNGNVLSLVAPDIVVLVNKPVGYVSSRDGQGSKTIYDLLPKTYRELKIAGRLDKDSSGLVILTNNGNLIYNLTHPGNNKPKRYLITTNKQINSQDINSLKEGRVRLDNKPSKLIIEEELPASSYRVLMSEGRNRQIRRMLEVLGYTVVRLERIELGPFRLNQLGDKSFLEVENIPNI